MAMPEAIPEEGSVAGGRLGELYVRHGPDAQRLAYLLTGDRTLAEDLVQDAFVRLAGRFADLRDPGAFPAYLRRMVVNLARMHFRRRRVERRFLDRERSQRIDGGSVPDVEGYEAMKAALLALPVRQRSAIVLRFYEDLPERQIAEILRCRPGTVKSLLHRGLATLRAQMEGDDDAD
jgi:RNA polymerase sigma-70 factor (sigma-E family)